MKNNCNSEWNERNDHQNIFCNWVFCSAFICLCPLWLFRLLCFCSAIIVYHPESKQFVLNRMMMLMMMTDCFRVKLSEWVSKLLSWRENENEMKLNWMKAQAALYFLELNKRVQAKHVVILRMKMFLRTMDKSHATTLKRNLKGFLKPCQKQVG